MDCVQNVRHPPRTLLWSVRKTRGRQLPHTQTRGYAVTQTRRHADTQTRRRADAQTRRRAQAHKRTSAHTLHAHRHTHFTHTHYTDTHTLHTHTHTLYTDTHTLHRQTHFTHTDTLYTHRHTLHTDTLYTHTHFTHTHTQTHFTHTHTLHTLNTHTQSEHGARRHGTNSKLHALCTVIASAADRMTFSPDTNGGRRISPPQWYCGLRTPVTSPRLDHAIAHASSLAAPQRLRRGQPTHAAPPQPRLGRWEKLGASTPTRHR